MTVDIEQDGSTRLVRINRPDVRNALDPETSDAIADALLGADNDRTVRVVVITGAGDRAFCAGMDLKAFRSGSRRPNRLTPVLRRGIETPVVAAVNGAAVGGGFELALMCDLIVAADQAWFALPEVTRGLFAAGGGALVLPRRLPLSIAMELGLTGRRLEARRAMELGLVNRVVTAAQLVEDALEFADQIAANGPLGVRATKALMRSADRPDSTMWAEVDRHREVVFNSDEAAEGAAAFVERRTPEW